jgi:hypothetical protein
MAMVIRDSMATMMKSKLPGGKEHCGEGKRETEIEDVKAEKQETRAKNQDRKSLRFF